MTSLQKIADDRRRGAAEIADKLIGWGEAWGGGEGQEGVAEVVADLEVVARSQSALAPVLRVANDLLAAVERRIDDEEEAIREAVAMVAIGWRKRLASAAESIGVHVRKALERVSTIYTYSASSTIRHALLAHHAAGEWFQVVMSEARPGGEGARMAASLAERGIPVRIGTDVWMWSAFEEEGVFLVGADALLSSGWVNKIGSEALASRAREQAVEVVVAADTSKWLPPALAALPRLYDRDPAELVFRPAPTLEARNVYFEEIPYAALDRLITERGVTRPEDLRSGDVHIATTLTTPIARAGDESRSR